MPIFFLTSDACRDPTTRWWAILLLWICLKICHDVKMSHKDWMDYRLMIFLATGGLPLLRNQEIARQAVRYVARRGIMFTWRYREPFTHQIVYDIYRSWWYCSELCLQPYVNSFPIPRFDMHVNILTFCGCYIDCEQCGGVRHTTWAGTADLKRWLVRKHDPKQTSKIYSTLTHFSYCYCLHYIWNLKILRSTGII